MVYNVVKVGVDSVAPGSMTTVDIQVSYSSDSLILHWGVVRDRKEYVHH